MSELRFTLIGDGSSDKALIPILRWLLLENSVEQPIQPEFHSRAGGDLASNIARGFELFPCDLLFIHRDAEKQPRESRKREILAAIKDAVFVEERPPAVCVVPVRMTEAWLLINETAIRLASGNPSGTQALDVPPIQRLERIPDPKDILHNTLRVASELKGRHLRTFRPHRQIDRPANLIEDFSPLRRLKAFQALEEDVKEIVDSRGWSTHADAP